MSLCRHFSGVEINSAFTKIVHTHSFIPSDLGGERAAGDVFGIKLDDDVVVSRCGGQVGHRACPVLIVLRAHLYLRGTFDSQRQTAYRDK